MHRCKFLGCLLLSALVRVLPATTFYWTGAAGDGKWNTKANWRTETADPSPKLPTEGMQDVVYFDVPDPTTIDVESRTSIHQFVIAGSSSALTFTSSTGSGWLEFFCNNGYAYTFPNVAVQDATNVTVCCSNATSCVTTFDCNVTFRNSGNIVFGPGCVFNGTVALPGPPIFSALAGVTPCAAAAKTVFNQGWTSSPNSLYLHSSQNELVIDRVAGSNATVAKYWYYPAGSDGKMTVKGGHVKVTGCFFYQSTNPVELNFENGTFECYINDVELFKYFRRTGGDLITCRANSYIPGSGLETDGILAPAGTKTWITRDRLNLFDRKDDSYFVGTYHLNAPIYMTNAANETVNFNIGWLYSYPLLTGPGEIQADYMNACGETVINTTLCAGKQFKCDSDGGTFVFSNATIRMYGDLPDYSSKSQAFRLLGTNTFDTANCHGLAKTHTAEFMTCYYDDPETVVNVVGGGLVLLRQYRDSNHPTDNMVAGELNVGAGTTVSLPDSLTVTLDKLTLGAHAKLLVSNGVLRVKTLVAGDGSEVHVKFATDKKGSFVTDELTQEGAFALALGEIASGTADAAYVAARSSFDESQTTVTLKDSTGRNYQTHFLDGVVYLAPDPIVPSTTYEWTGAQSAYWSVAGNWTALPVAGAAISVSGFNNLAMRNDFTAGTTFESITFLNTAGPFSLSGNALALSGSVPAVNQSFAEETIDCDVTFTQKTVTLKSTANTSGGLTFNGKVRTTDGDYTDHLFIEGLVRFGGDAIIHKLMLTDNESTLQVLAGGRVAVTNQTNLSAQTLNKGQLVVDEGGVFEWAASNAKPFFWSGAHVHTVNGQLIVNTRYGASDGKVQTYTGTGRLDILGGFNYLKNQTLPLEGGMHLYTLTDFPTADADGSDSCATISLSDSTLGAITNWTYGPAAAVTDISTLLTTPEQRALKLLGESAIDTDNPDTGESHTITFVDPIDGAYGSLEIRGAGEVVVTDEGCDFSGGLILSSGTLRFTYPCTTPIPAGRVTCAGGGITFPKSLRSQFISWRSIISATSVEGTLVDPQNFIEYRTVPTESGVDIQARARTGGLLILYR